MSAIENGMVIEHDERRPLDLDSIVRRCKTDSGAEEFVMKWCDPVVIAEAVVRLCAQSDNDYEELGRVIKRTLFDPRVKVAAEYAEEEHEASY